MIRHSIKLSVTPSEYKENCNILIEKKHEDNTLIINAKLHLFVIFSDDKIKSVSIEKIMSCCSCLACKSTDIPLDELVKSLTAPLNGAISREYFGRGNIQDEQGCLGCVYAHDFDDENFYCAPGDCTGYFEQDMRHCLARKKHSNY